LVDSTDDDLEYLKVVEMVAYWDKMMVDYSVEMKVSSMVDYLALPMVDKMVDD
jgi:hypothetical protein